MKFLWFGGGSRFKEEILSKQAYWVGELERTERDVKYARNDLEFYLRHSKHELAEDAITELNNARDSLLVDALAVSLYEIEVTNENVQ